MIKNTKPKKVQPLKGKTKKCQNCKRVNESEHHLLCQDCWEKKKNKDFFNSLNQYSKRKEANNNKALQDILNKFLEILNPHFEKFKVIEKASKGIKREMVFEHMMDSGDYFRVFLLDKPRLNDVDDIEVEMNGVMGTTAFGIQDWEAMALMDGLNKAILKKYGTYENAIKKLVESGKVIIQPELNSEEAVSIPPNPKLK
jgi:hypothetical protein